jgi:hypothetical protein
MWESSGWISDIDPFGWFQWLERVCSCVYIRVCVCECSIYVCIYIYIYM